MFCVFWTVSHGTGRIWRKFSLLFFCRLSPDCIKILSIAKKFFAETVLEQVLLLKQNLSMITTSESRQLQNTTDTRQGRLQCDRGDRDRFTFRQYLIIPSMPTVFERITSVNVGSMSSDHCLSSVGLHSVESERSRDRLGRILPGERYKLDKKRIENGIIWINWLGNGRISRLPDQYLMLSGLNYLFYKI